MQRNCQPFQLFPGFCGLSFKQIRHFAGRPRKRPQPRASSTTRSRHRSQTWTSTRKSACTTPEDAPVPKARQSQARNKDTVGIQSDDSSCIESTTDTGSEAESMIQNKDVFAGQMADSSSLENTTGLLVCESLTSNCTSSTSEEELIIVHEESHPQVHARDTQRIKRLSSENYSVNKCFICQSGKKTKEAVSHPSQEAISKVLNLIADRIKFKDGKALTTCALLTESSPTAADLEGAWCHRTCYREFGNIEQKNRAEKRYKRALLTGE